MRPLYPLRPRRLPFLLVASVCCVLGACAGGNSDTPSVTPGFDSAGVDSSGAGSTTAGAAAENAGTTANGGMNAATGGTNSAGGAGSNGAASSIDYSLWVLQLPTGNGTTITTVSSSQLWAGYADAYFYPADDGGQTFMDPATGTTTAGSQHCRTEMRELAAGGGHAAWASSGTNVMTVSGKVLKIGGGANGKVTVGQIFNETDSIPLCDLQYSTRAGGFLLLYEEAKGQGSPTDLKTPIALSSKYSFTLALTQGVVSVTVNGTPVYTRTPSASILGKKFYFKFGNYDQTATAGPISTTPYTIVEAYGVSVLHE